MVPWDKEKGQKLEVFPNQGLLDFACASCLELLKDKDFGGKVDKVNTEVDSWGMSGWAGLRVYGLLFP